MLRLHRASAAVAAAGALGPAARAALPALSSALQFPHRAGVGTAARIQARPSLGGLSLRALSLSASFARSKKVPEEPGGAPHDVPPADALLERAALGAASAGPAAASSEPPKLHPNYSRLPMPDPLPARVEGKRVVVGTDFLKTLAKGGFIVDKSLACKALLESPNEAMRICLPRRFGKSFNLSVITQFFNPITAHDCVAGAGARDFDAAYERRRQMFSGSLLLERHPDFFDEHFAAIPIIWINFKGVTGKSLGAFCKSLARALHEAAKFWLAAYDDSGRMKQSALTGHASPHAENSAIDHRLGDDPGRLNPSAREMYKALKDDCANFKRDLRDSADQWERRDDLVIDLFVSLSDFVAAQHSGQYILLIDEYDAPLKTALDTDWYDDAENAYIALLSAMLKENTRLRAGLLVGVHEFELSTDHSGLNSVKALSLTTARYSPDPALPTDIHDFGVLGPLAKMFAFTRQDVSALVEKTRSEFRDAAGAYSHDEIMAAITNWYDGYDFGFGDPRYSPFSVLGFLEKMAAGHTIEVAATPYWVDTGNTASITRLAQHHHDEILELAPLLLGDYATKNPEASIRAVYHESKGRCVLPAGEFQHIDIRKTSYPGSRITLSSTNDLVTLLIHLGCLTLGPGNAVRIPNRELESMWRNLDAFARFGPGAPHEMSVLRDRLIADLWAGKTDVIKECVYQSTRYSANVGAKTDSEQARADALRNFLGHLLGGDPRASLVSEPQSGDGRLDMVILLAAPPGSARLGVVIVETKHLSRRAATKRRDKAMAEAGAIADAGARARAMDKADTRFMRATDPDKCKAELEELVQAALDQIASKQYPMAFESRGVRMDVGIATSTGLEAAVGSRLWTRAGRGHGEGGSRWVVALSAPEGREQDPADAC